MLQILFVLVNQYEIVHIPNIVFDMQLFLDVVIEIIQKRELDQLGRFSVLLVQPIRRLFGN